MTAPNGRVLPKLSVLETSRSIRRALITSESSPLSARKCTTPIEQPDPTSTRSKSSGDEHALHFHCTSRLGWFACSVVVTLTALLLLATQSVSSDWKSHSLRCWADASSPSSDEQSFLPSVDDQDGKWGVKKYDNHRSGDKPSLLHAGGNVGRFGRKHYNMTGEVEDESCWSRTRIWMYRPYERRFPLSPLLIRALEEYEARHARCTAGIEWEKFFQLGNRGEDSCKYLMYIEGPEGLGNRFLSLVTAFIYALVTDRVLLVDSRRNMSSLICEPFQGLSWTLPDDFPYEKADELASLEEISDGQLEEMDAVRLNLRHVQSEKDSGFFCSEVQERLSGVRWVEWKSNQWYLTKLFEMPEYWPKLKLLFDEPSRAFTQLSRVLLLPRNDIWAKTERIHEAYLATSDNLVGIQVRSPQFPEFQQPIQDRLVQCLQEKRLVPKPHGESSALDNITETPKERTALFVASLRREYYEQLREMYIERGAEDGTPVSVHTMSWEGEENKSFDQSLKAFVDILLLSFSDSLVTSGWSTFGYIAQSMGAVNPHIVNTDPTQDAVSCDLGQSLDPCAHYLFFCPASNVPRTVEHEAWIKKHIRPCQDQTKGIQFVAS